VVQEVLAELVVLVAEEPGLLVAAELRLNDRAISEVDVISIVRDGKICG
jgi:hypothetical protein